jgi:nitroreductase
MHPAPPAPPVGPIRTTGLAQAAGQTPAAGLVRTPGVPGRDRATSLIRASATGGGHGHSHGHGSSGGFMETIGVVAAMRRRRSTPRLAEPGPHRDEIAWLLDAAVTAPDHGRLKPWRFVVFEGDARRAFGDVLAAGYESRCRDRGQPVIEQRVETERGRLMRAPLVLAVGAHITTGNVTRDAQVCAVAAAAQNVLLAATELGYGTMWRSGAACADESVKTALGLLSDDVLLGFLYIGTACVTPPPAPDRSLAGVVRWWRPAARCDQAVPEWAVPDPAVPDQTVPEWAGRDEARAEGARALDATGTDGPPGPAAAASPLRPVNPPGRGPYRAR